MASEGKKVSSRRQRNDGQMSVRLKRMRGESLKPPIASAEDGEIVRPHATLDCGWGKLIFAQTFKTNEGVVEALRAERNAGSKDIGLLFRAKKTDEANALKARAP